ncbi:Phenmedipham hydrolase [Taenia crassiceps]|uniref:Phenmedipham hydrolase n=1 Tax=Taenia crassiceps TaxID=6207 RepID=A0ABR4QLG8_9CEST
MACGRVRVVEYRKLLDPEEFFQYGRPHVEPLGSAIVCRRPLDKILLYLITFSLLGLIMHFLVAFFLLPTFPKPLPNATTECATLVGLWSSDYTVLRFFGVPYSIPPLAKPDMQTLDVLQEYLHVKGGTPVLRWQMPQEIKGIEGCILAQHDRCSFQRSRWTCNLGRSRPVSTCSQPVPGRKVDMTNSYALFQQERCLQVDITAPLYAGVLKPVIVLIAGFQFFTEPLMPPHYQHVAFWPTDEVIRDTDAVWVYLHYRLGFAGFFYNLTDPIASDKTKYQLSNENFALHDQLMGLRWIKQHVKQFGGDPTRITVLGSGSGATSTLALLYMKARNEDLFHQAWLSSGAVHWKSNLDNGMSRSIVEQAFTNIVAHYTGAHCITGIPGTISKSCPLDELRNKLTAVPMAVFNSLLSDFLDDSKLIGKLVGSNDGNGGLSWISAEVGSGALPPPRFWTPEEINRALNLDGKPIRLVFSSMSNELEGWPGMGDLWISQPDDEQIEQFAEMLNRFKRPSPHSLQSLKYLLGVAWREEISSKSHKAVRRSRQEFHMELLSLLRFSCPQSWILSKLNASKGIFYKIVLDEPPDLVVPYTPGPRPTEKSTSPAKRYAFHALDMMILVGKRIGSGLRDTPHKNRFRKFKQKLKQMFKDFVHGKNVNSQCRATATGTTTKFYDIHKD